MGPSARAIAEQASFQAFLHSYLQEIDPGHWLAASQHLHDPGSRFSGSWVCELPLNTQRARLAVDILYRSPSAGTAMAKCASG